MAAASIAVSRPARRWIFMVESWTITLCVAFYASRIALERGQLEDVNSGMTGLHLDFGNISAAALRPQPSESRRIVVLPGPHKTGTTLVQSCLYQWITKQRHTFFRTWAWHLPSLRSLQRANVSMASGPKGFAPLLSVLRGDTKFTRGQTDLKKVVEIYRDAQLDAWDRGYSIVLGAEAMDYAVSDKVNTTQIMNGIITILPLNNATVEVVVNVRLPKVDHLKSVWHNMGGTLSFSQWILSDHSTHLFMTDSMRLAIKFLEHSNRTNVILLDVEGVDQAGGIGMCDAIACDVLNVSCKDHRVQGTIEMHNHTKTDRGAMDLTDRQIETLENIFSAYDCGLHSKILDYSNRFSVLYQHKLFATCKDGTGYPERSLSWLKQQLESAVGNGDAT